MLDIPAIEAATNQRLFDHQHEAVLAAEKVDPRDRAGYRACLYYKTGAGKSLTSLAMLAVMGYTEALVIAPPSTHSAWQDLASLLGMNISTISHAKFRQKTFKVSRTCPIVADEMHMFGGHGGQGWVKLDRAARGMQAPVIMASATPNYNDIDRVYCIQHILDPASAAGGFINFLYQHCITEPNPYGMLPKVVGLHRFANAAEYLAALPNVFYLEDDLEYDIIEKQVHTQLPDEFKRFGLWNEKTRIMASAMERKHAIAELSLIDDTGIKSRLVPPVAEELRDIINSHGHTLVFATHKRVAWAAKTSLNELLALPGQMLVVDGDMNLSYKEHIIKEARNGDVSVLIGTATLATGTDGLDKVFDSIVLLDDTEDDSLRRQLIGRIMPRGMDQKPGKVVGKYVYRFNL